MKEKINRLAELGFTQQSIANAMGVSKSTVSAWAKGDRKPSAENEERFNTWLQHTKEMIANI